MSEEKTKGLDQETRMTLTDGAKMRALARSEGWAEAKAIIHNDIIRLANITELPLVGDILVEIRARQLVVDTLLGWLTEIEGAAKQYKNHAEQMRDIMGSNHFLRLADEEEDQS